MSSFYRLPPGRHFTDLDSHHNDLSLIALFTRIHLIQVSRLSLAALLVANFEPNKKIIEKVEMACLSTVSKRGMTVDGPLKPP